MQTLSFLPLIVFAGLAVVAGLKDVTSYTIPNWISLALLGAFPFAALLGGVGWTTAGLCLAVGFGLLLVGMLMFALRWVGGGDAKFLAACALWMGVTGLPSFLLITALAGGALTFGLMSLRSGWLEPIIAGSPAWVRRLGDKKGDVPYGVAIAVGALAALPQSAIGLAILN
ncbi:pilus assembly protein CpaA [Caulobacter sp. D4A]|uniref:A24 family peptidase n=1 Tax=unclassified Caulobacter TaxID=2648921 RepID=UPI000D737339|nr:MULTISPECIES: prepilin peptidase [unclassified Caulobacter]PXA87041.1 pilus assembly protein CpaA [Caulobacter sp. D5]PXA88250.1 pilus assembly protein CpaA [Caulobacter sp. D4A]